MLFRRFVFLRRRQFVGSFSFTMVRLPSSSRRRWLTGLPFLLLPSSFCLPGSRIVGSWVLRRELCRHRCVRLFSYRRRVVAGGSVCFRCRCVLLFSLFPSVVVGSSSPSCCRRSVREFVRPSSVRRLVPLGRLGLEQLIK